MGNVTVVCWAIFSVALATIVGCGPTTGTVSGTVTVDGKPLETGVIAFVPADGKGAPITVDIKAGSYKASAVAGQKRVQISAPVVTGQRPEYNGPGAPLVDITAEIIPAKYNSDTELTFDLPVGGTTKDWSVESIRGGKK